MLCHFSLYNVRFVEWQQLGGGVLKTPSFIIGTPGIFIINDV